MAHVIELSGKIALVTGAGHGIGAKTALALARAGAKTVVNYRKSADKAEAVVKKILGEGGQAVALQADVTDRAQVDRMARDVQKRWGPVDILVNNALQQLPWLNFLEQSWEAYQGQIDGCLKSLCNTGWAFIPAMKEKKWGRIININTVCFFDCGAHQSAYASGKGAMDCWSRSVAKELAPDNITVNQIAPGWMRTNDSPDSEHSLGYAKRVPMKRQGDCEEIGKACVFFASDLADFITGTMLPVSGGMLQA